MEDKSAWLSEFRGPAPASARRASGVGLESLHQAELYGKHASVQGLQLPKPLGKTPTWDGLILRNSLMLYPPQKVSSCLSEKCDSLIFRFLSGLGAGGSVFAPN